MTGAVIEVRLLGLPHVTRDGRLVEVDTSKAIALLAYLAIEKTTARDTAALLFWSESSTERARAALRRTLSALRSGVGPDVVSADRNQIELSGDIWCDVNLFDQEILSTADHGHDAADVCPQCAAPLERAASLYRGDFMEGFSVRNAPDFEVWARNVAESVRLRAGEMFNKLAMSQASTGDYPTAIATVGRWLELDELHEPAHRLLMLLNAWAGDRPGAIHAYRSCVAILERELGVPPLEETTELYEAILDEDLPPAPGTPRSVKMQPSAVTRVDDDMIDREDAVAALGGALDALRSRGSLFTVTGASWMGKTRLLEHLEREARARSLTVAAAQGYRTEQKLPYGVAIQILDVLTPLVDDLVEPPPEWAFMEMARLDPRLGAGRGAPSTADFDQLRFREAILVLVTAVSSAKPMVMSIDDAQWVDPASAGLLAYLARRLADDSVLVVLSFRSGEPLDPALGEIVAKTAHSISLRPLQSSDLSVIDASHAERLVEATGGVPLLVREALESDGDLQGSSTVARYMESQLRGVSDLGRQVLAAASVLSGMCEPALLRETSGRAEDEFVEAVEELLTARLLVEKEDGRLVFGLDALEPLVYQSTSLVRRRLLHRRAAQALEAQPWARADARLATAVAGQLSEAGDNQAANWYRLAGDLSREVHALAEARKSYETAIALGVPDLGSVRLSLGEIAMTLGEYDRALQELRTAASLSEASTLALVEHRTGDLQRLIGRFDLAEESFTRAVNDHPSPTALYADWALLRHRTGNSEAAISMARRSLQAAREEGDDEAVARSLNILSVVTPDDSEAMAYVEEALALVPADEPTRMAALNNKAHLLTGSGDVDSAVSLVDEAIRIAEKAGLRHYQAALLNHLADLHHAAGRRPEQEASLREAVAIFADIDAGGWEPEVWFLRRW